MAQLASSHESGNCCSSASHLDSPEAQKKTTKLTLDLALRILRSALARPILTDDEATEIIDYHLERNRIARTSHRKTWFENHKNVKFKVLL